MILKIIKAIIFAVGSYYLIKFIMYVISPSKKNKKTTTNTNNTPTVTHVPKNNKGKINPNAGDYVEYEEVDDN